jgi:ATP-dependent RNA helicase RhlE
LHQGAQITWKELKLTSQFIRALDENGFQYPTLIQERSIPAILAGQKVIGIAQTGTGKTAAYLLPILNQLKYAQGNNPRLLVLAPTKELVIQIGKHCRFLSQFTDLRTVDLFGGVGTKAQVDLLTGGVDIIISTPGRFLELYRMEALSTKQLKTLVIDEADRMMDMNFMPQIRLIQEVLPSRRQNLLFSATFPFKVEKLAEEFIDFPVKIEVTPQSSVTSQVSQSLYLTPNFKAKLDLLLKLLSTDSLDRVILFARTKENVINLSKFLERSDVGSVRAIHSNKSQNARINALNDFRDGQVRILISTDVTARGIDVDNISHVINFDVPVLYEDYIHRIGRTGRALKTGIAITFSTEADLFHISKIEKLMGEKIRRIKLPESILIEATPFHEAQKLARELDRQKKINDPTFKGAFHERKK